MITHYLLGKCERRKCHTGTLKHPCDGRLTPAARPGPGTPPGSFLPLLISCRFLMNSEPLVRMPPPPYSPAGLTNSCPLTSLPWGLTMETDNPCSLYNRRLCFNPPPLCISVVSLVWIQSGCGGLTVTPGASLHLWFTSVCGFSDPHRHRIYLIPHALH